MSAPITAPARYAALVEDALRAPSPHNTQPWEFRERDGALELHADRSRRMAVNDPRGRELVIACGAALTNLCVSAEHHHFTPTVELFPDDDDRDHLATVRLAPREAWKDARLSYGIRLRGTWREPFAIRALPQALKDEMLTAAQEPGVWVHVVDQQQLSELIGLVTSGDHFQFHDPGWRHELASWLHPRRAGDGHPVPPIAGAISRFVVSHLDLGERTARDDADLLMQAPLVLVVGTDADDERSWLAAGMALERLLLTAALQGVQAGFTNSACQVPVVRTTLASVIGREHPQVVLRMGFPTEAPQPTPRRPVDEVLER